MGNFLCRNKKNSLYGSVQNFCVLHPRTLGSKIPKIIFDNKSEIARNANMCFVEICFDLLILILPSIAIFHMLKYSYRHLKSFLNIFKRDSFEILVITTPQECDVACYKLRAHCNKLSALGFDCEWVAGSVQSPVALLQLASPNDLCCLFRLNLIQYVPPSLENIMNDRTILKLGVDCCKDANLLLKDYDVQVQGALDLRHLYPAGGGLASLAKSEADMVLDKTSHIQFSDWECTNLSKKQEDYAAKDALAGIKIFKQWLLQNTAKAYGRTEMTMDEYRYAYFTYAPTIERLLDIPFKQIHFPSRKQNTAVSLYMNNQKKFTPLSLFMNNKKKFKDVYVTRKSPLYHNCFMYAPDGELLCSCDTRKAEWYVERGLAEVLPGDPYSIRLLFEPAARAGDTNGGRYYQQLKQNCCVVCGALHSYLKHNVVPKEYRKHFPTEMKDHQSHDIVLMCIRCHHLAAQHNDFLRQQLALKCNAPITTSKTVQNTKTQKVKNCAKALITSGNVIPSERKNTLENEVKRFYNVNYLSQELLQEAANLNSKIINENCKSHGLKVINYYGNRNNGLIELEKLWREHFLKTMNPQYLPALWSVTHNHSRLAAKAAEKKV